MIHPRTPDPLDEDAVYVAVLVWFILLALVVAYRT
jgi:hypothetical protein